MKGPLSAVKKLKGVTGQEPSRDRLEQLEEAEKNEKSPRVQTMDKVSQVMDDPVYCTDYTWPFLSVKNQFGAFRQLYVSRYYMRSKFALDMMPSYEPDPAEIALKKERLEEHGLRYFCLHAGNSLSDLAAYLGE